MSKIMCRVRKRLNLFLLCFIAAMLLPRFCLAQEGAGLVVIENMDAAYPVPVQAAAGTAQAEPDSEQAEGMLRPPQGYAETPQDAQQEASGSQGNPESGLSSSADPSADAPAGSIFSASVGTSGSIVWNPYWPYAGNSVIHSGLACLYRSPGSNGYVVCVNAGHGTSGGESQQTLSHPDGSPKFTGGTNAQGAVYSMSISSGTTMADGTTEADTVLRLALKVKEKLLSNGFDVIMIRETQDVQLDNIARTVIANAWANCHVALHYDSTASDKGAFYCGVPQVASYLEMDPVSAHWQEHEALGQSLIRGLQQAGIKIYGEGRMEMDLTQTSYSTIPSVDLECGDTASDLSDAALDRLAEGILYGIQAFAGY